jgi:hypothetical protein
MELKIKYNFTTSIARKTNVLIRNRYISTDQSNRNISAYKLLFQQTTEHSNLSTTYDKLP